MVYLTQKEKIIAHEPRRRMGYSQNYGSAHFGYCLFGLDNPFAGQYQKLVRYGKWEYVKMPFYWPKNPKTENQKVCQDRFAECVSEWQGMDENEKNEWRVKAKKSGLPGFHFFMSYKMFNR
jgi:hypothetical protein